MYVDSCTYTANGKKHTRHLLRESFRQDGKVCHRTLANLTHCSEQEVDAIKLALKHKADLQQLGSIHQDIETRQGTAVGAVWTLWQVAQRIGLVKALGSSQQGRQALWQVFARVLEQGSRLSAVRLANAHAAFGYNRDGKSGKYQIVYGLLCDPQGVPVSIEAFPGNTIDTKTFGSQVRKVAKRFGGKGVTLVGDRGMIKGPQIKHLQAEKDLDLHYITAITKPQIESLLKQGLIQMSLFDETVAEVTDEDADIRYVLRRNPVRAAEMAATRESKWAKLQQLVAEQNAYLAEHCRAEVSVARRKIETRHKSLRLPDIALSVNERTITLAKQHEDWQEATKLDGCYCLKTDLSKQQASKETVHERYKDLSRVEWAFRTCKTMALEARPVYVHLESRTRGHLLVVMLAYLIVQELSRCWRDFDLTVEEGLSELKSLCTTQVVVKGRSVLHNVPQPRASVQKLLDAAGVTLPKTVVDRGVRVSTRKKLTEERKTA